VTATFFKHAVGLNEEYLFVEWRSAEKFQWEVRVLTGQEHGAENAKHLYTRSAKTQSEAEIIFHKICAEYRRQGWKEANPLEM
jgi:hypothetical protein